MTIKETEISKILQQIQPKDWQKKLKFISTIFDNATFSSSFSIEDQVITDFIVRYNLPIEIFTIDTGRLPQETYDVWQNTLDKYGVKISAYYPNQDQLAEFVKKNGINAFYNSVELRKGCCQIRKVEPLQRALKNKNLWISGLRREHSASRAAKDFLEYDAQLNLAKFYPLLETSEAELWNYITENRVPFNQLYKLGYRSIGCAPCTRAVLENEDIRDGRWWWENDTKKECGLHITK